MHSFKGTIKVYNLWHEHNDNEALASNVAKVDVIKWLVKVLRLKEIYKLAQAKVNLFTIDSLFLIKCKFTRLLAHSLENIKRNKSGREIVSTL